MLNLHLPYSTQIKTMMMLRRAATKQASLFPGLAAPRSAMLYSTQPSNVKDDALTTANELHVNEDTLGMQTGQVSGAPQELQDRTVQIYKMSPSSTQSGRQQQKGWRLNWDIIPRANKWEDTTIGYASSGDYMQATEMHFHTRQDAINFAVRQGWNYYVREPKQRTWKPKVYGDNFVHHPGKLKMIFTK